MNESEVLFPKEHQNLDKSTELMLLTLAKIGTRKELLDVLLEFSLIEFSKDQQRYLLGPIIQHKSAWQETTPQRLYEAITYDRMKLLFSELKGESTPREVGPIELVTVIYPATMDGPIRHELSSIYLRAGSYAHAFKHKQQKEEFWKLMDTTSITDEEVKQPGGNYYYEYQQLCSSIRNKVVKTQKERETKSNKKHSQSKASITKNPDIIQGELF